MIIPNREELAWAAGFFDGEGSSMCCTPHGNYRYLRLSVGQKDREMLDRFQAAVGGLGTIVYASAGRGRCGMFYWRVQSFQMAQAVLAMLWPFLGIHKRAQAMRATQSFWLVPHRSPIEKSSRRQEGRFRCAA